MQYRLYTATGWVVIQLFDNRIHGPWKVSSKTHRIFAARRFICRVDLRRHILRRWCLGCSMVFQASDVDMTYVERNEHLDRTYSSKPSHRSRGVSILSVLVFSLSSLYHLPSYKRQKQLLIVRWCALWEKDPVYSFSSKNLRVLPNFPLLDCPWVSISIHKYPWYIHDQVWNRLAADCPGLSSKIRPLPSYIFRKATSPPHQFPLRTMTLRGVQASNAGAAKVESAASRSEYHWISALDRQFFGTWTVERCLRTLICCSLQRNRLAAHRQQRTTESMRGLCGLLRIRPWRVGCLEWGSHEGDLMAA